MRVCDLADRVLGFVGALVDRSAPPASGLEALAGPAADSDLHVMTFNLRYAGSRRPNAWSQRRPVMRALLRAERPHLIGTQEGLARQLADVAADLGPAYARVGTGRQGGTLGEFNAIFYDTRRLELLAHGDFWLSDTPDVAASSTWGCRFPRMATWARLADRVTGTRFHALNTHLDNDLEDARQRSAELIRLRLAAFDPALPVMLTGDFNCGARPGCPAYETLVGGAGLVDAWLAAGSRSAWYATAHAYRGTIPDGPRIDWILTSPGVTVTATLINPYQRRGQYPSDHFPVQARLRLPTPPATG